MKNSNLYIETARGPLHLNDLGRTYIHEHLRINLSQQKNDPDADLNDPVNIAVELKDLKNKGVDSIVEVTNRGMGRDAALLKKLSGESGINVIVSTGFYKEPFLPGYVYEREEKELADLLITEIREGIDGTGIKAQVIGEVGTGKGRITPTELKVLKVAAQAHGETGRPIYTHTTLGTMALEQVEIFRELKADLAKVVIGHVDLKCDPDYHLRIADYGCFLGYDTIGKLKYETDEKRAETIKTLIEKGYRNQILLSQDITRRSQLKTKGGLGYSHLCDRFIPLLQAVGVKEEDIEHMLVENPRRLLEARED